MPEVDMTMRESQAIGNFGADDQSPDTTVGVLTVPKGSQYLSHL